jgi:hypothetical protein
MASNDPIIPLKESNFTNVGNRRIATRGFSHDALEEHLRDMV